MHLQNLDARLTVSDLAREAVRSGLIAAVAMIPFGLVFFLAGLRVNEYGMAVVQTFFGGLPLPARFGLFVVEHLIISVTVAAPLLLAFLALPGIPRLWIGALYGAGFYVGMNSLLLPALFGDPTPWQLGFEVVVPSLIVHLVYGISIALTARSFVERHASVAEVPAA